MRVSTVLVLALVAFATISVSYAEDDMTMTTMDDMEHTMDGMDMDEMPPHNHGDCRLNKLRLNGPNDFTPAYEKDTHEYFCSCLFAQSSTTITHETIDSMSTVTIQLNQRPLVTAPLQTGEVTTGPYPIAVGTNKFLIDVTCGNCHEQYNITCIRSPPNQPQIVGDPMFAGLSGQSFQIHGVAGEVYNTISDRRVQVNALFVFLTGGSCPIINGVKAKNCWTHPGTYLGEIGVKLANGKQIRLSSGSAKTGFAGVTLDGRQMTIGDETLLTNTGADEETLNDFVSYNGTHTVTVRAYPYQIEFENSDNFVNQKLTLLDNFAQSHGLIGQTWSDKTYTGAVKEIQGEVDDYLVPHQDLFGGNYVYNRFD